MKKLFVAHIRLSLIVLVLNSTACSQRQKEIKTTLYTFGTLINITLYDVTQKQADIAFKQLGSDFQHYNHDWSPWIDGALAKANQHLKQGEAYKLPAYMIPLIRQGIVFSKQSKGMFNPTIGNLINLWQFHIHDKPNIKPPSQQAIQAILDTHPDVSDISINGSIIRSSNPAVQLSLGAYAKGYGVQLALNTLNKMGIHNAVINAGGDLGVIGKHGKRDWDIGIRNPDANGVIASVKVKSGENVFTSGNYERYYFYKHKRYHHIIDPTTGYPTVGFSSTTVIGNNASEADAAATALMVAGPKRWLDIAHSMKLKYVMLIDEHGTIYMNPKMAKRITLENPGSAHIVLSHVLTSNAPLSFTENPSNWY